MAKKNKRAAQAEAAPAAPEAVPLWKRRYFPAAFFLLLSLVYFYEFPLSGDIIYGISPDHPNELYKTDLNYMVAFSGWALASRGAIKSISIASGTMFSHQRSRQVDRHSR